MPSLIKPPRLQAGDTIGAWSPSWPAVGLFPHRLTRAKHNLDGQGYVLKLAPNARRVAGHIAGSAAERAADLHTLFRDAEVKAIISGIGGENSNELLPLLDWDLIRSHPKILLGYSDTTVLLNAITVRTGLITFHGPALIPQWGEYPETLAFTLRWFRQVLRRAQAPGPLDQPEAYTDEWLDWEQRQDETRSRLTRPAPPWRWLRPGAASGPLIGGHLASLHLLAGASCWPDFHGAIWFWEAVWAEESLAAVHRYLSAFANLGVLDQIAGMVIALPDRLTPAGIEEVQTFLAEFLSPWSFPVLFGPCFGHLDPMLTLPIGIRATLDSEANRFSLDEPAVSPTESAALPEAAAFPGAIEALLDGSTLVQNLGETEAAVLLSWARARLEGGEDVARVLAAIRRIDRIIGQRSDLSSGESLHAVMRLIAETR